MDYKEFYAEVADWIDRVNQMAAKLGIKNPRFWEWVADSTSRICEKYQNNPLVKKQMIMLVEWLEEVYEKQGG